MFLSRPFQIIQGRLVCWLAFLGIQIDHVEKQRFQLRSRHVPVHNTMRGTAGKDGHADIDGVIEEKNKEPKTLFASFAGLTFLPGGFPRAEFQTVLSMAAE